MDTDNLFLHGTNGFDAFVCEGEKITAECDGFTFTATVERDDNSDAPWERDDGHGPVSDWTTRDKRPGEMVLSQDGRAKRFYDMQEATKIALADGWGLREGYPGAEALTARQKAALAAMIDYTALRAWCADDWHYVGVCVSVSRAGVVLTDRYGAALWGIEANYPGSDNSYLTETACELAEQALTAARAKLAELCECGGTAESAE